MSQQQCSNCPHLQAEVRRLQAENALLRRIIQQAQLACMAVHAEADKTLSIHQPRGVWGYARGAKQAAETIVKYLSS